MPHQCTTCGRSFEDGSKEMLSGCPDCGGNKFQFQPATAVDGSTGGNTSGGAASAATAQKKTPESARSTQKSRSSATEAVEKGETVNPDKRVKSDERVETGATDAPETGGDERASAVNRAAETVRDWVGKRTDGNTQTDQNKQTGDDSSKTGATGSTRNDTPTQSGTTAGTARNHQTPENSVPKSEDSAQASARRDVVSESELPDEPPQNAATTDAPADSNATADLDTDANVVDAPDDQSPGLNELREELNSQFESIRIVEPGQYELNLMELYEREEYIISLKEDGKYIIEVPDAWDATDR